jgi:PE-PPE domain
MVIYARPVIIAAATGFIMAAPAAHADDTGSDLLVGSTQGFVLGPTGIPDPAIFPGYTPTIENDYLVPLGFSPNGTLTDLYTPETPWFGTSIAQGVVDLDKAVEDAHNTGQITPSDPETIVGYSQSTVVMS